MNMGMEFNGAALGVEYGQDAQLPADVLGIKAELQ